METNQAKHWIKNVVIAIFGFIILGLFIKSCGKDKEINNLKLDMIEYDQRFMERIKSDSTRAYQQNQIIASKDVAIKMLGDEAKHYRNIKSVVKTKLVYVHDTAFAEYTTHDTLLKPIGREFCYEDKFDTICGKVDSLGVIFYPHITDLGEMTSTIANKKYGFLNMRPRSIVDIGFTNPNVRTTGLQNVVVETKKPKRLIWLITGLGLGLIGGALIH